MRIKQYIIFLGCLLAASSCKEDEYVYPSVLTEMVDIKTDSSGKLSFISTDNGKAYQADWKVLHLIRFIARFPYLSLLKRKARMNPPHCIPVSS